MRCGFAKPTKEAALVACLLQADPESGAPGTLPGPGFLKSGRESGAGSSSHSDAIPFPFLDHTCPFTTVHLKHI